MTELAIRTEATDLADVTYDQQDQSIARLAEWAKVAGAVHHLATGLCKTQFVPAAYRDKPMEASAAILAGAEVGLSPMGSLRAFDNIQGTPAPKAVTLRAIVQGRGHRVKIVESTPTRAVVSALRRGEAEWQTSVWDLDRARQMDLLGKDQWKKQPQAMLVARATAEVCRWVASDAIMGMPYTAEEIRDGEFVDSDRTESGQRITPADILGATAATAAVGGGPTLPVDRAIFPSEANEPVSAPPNVKPDNPMNRPQQSKMFALFAQKGVTTPGQQRTFIVEAIGRQVQSRGELTKDDAKAVIDALEKMPTLPADESEQESLPTQAPIPGGAE